MTRAIQNRSYDAHSSLEGHECFYCGSYADTIDHVPPISLLNFYANYYRVLLKACKECNYSLSAKFLPTPISRLEFLIKNNKRKYKKILKMPKWSHEEIKSLRGSLKKYIESEIEFKSIVEKRLKFLQNRLDELYEK